MTTKKANLSTETAEDKQWHKGRPPHVGWWIASRSRNKVSWRWWNGKNWSNVYTSGDDGDYVADASSNGQKAYSDKSKPIEWCSDYPENARVPRVDPNQKPKLRIVSEWRK